MFNGVLCTTFFKENYDEIWLGSGCGSVGIMVAFNTRGPEFDSSHWQKFTLNICLFTCLLSTVLKRRK